MQAFIMSAQIDPITRARFGLNKQVPNSTACISEGMDQGFHNWLLFSGRLQRIMNVKVFPQGEGPVNTVGAFYLGHQALLRWRLDAEWNILRGEDGNKYISNWNGDPSPIVHQLDRFQYVLYLCTSIIKLVLIFSMLCIRPSQIRNLGGQLTALKGL
jgi:hypothetical protein